MEDIIEQPLYFTDCGNGWGIYMTNLKSVPEAGLDLRNKKVTLKTVRYYLIRHVELLSANLHHSSKHNFV